MELDITLLPIKKSNKFHDFCKKKIKNNEFWNKIVFSFVVCNMIITILLYTIHIL